MVSIVYKVLIQVYAKVGGIPWSVSNMPFLRSEPTMVCGLDVFSKARSKLPSILGFTASVNPTCTRFFSLAR